MSPSIVARGQVRDGYDDDIETVQRQLDGTDSDGNGPLGGGEK
ncbi:MAG: hypothetical protein WCB95_08285 [Aeromicrobium sp.]